MHEAKKAVFKYGETEINYLKQRDPKLGRVIDQIGWIERAVDDDRGYFGGWDATAAGVRNHL